MLRSARWWLAAAILLVAPAPAMAYVGPGAGFAFVSSLLIILVTTLLAILTLLTWPIRWVVQRIRGSRALGAARARRVVVLGLDGQDPELTEQFLAEGPAPELRAAAGARNVHAAPDDASRRVPGGLDVVPDRLQPRQAPHLRLPGAEPGVAPSRARLGARRPAGPLPAPRALPHPDRQAAHQRRAPQRPVLEDPRRPRDLQHHPARADHVPGRALRRRAAVGDERARSAGHAGHVHLLHQRPGRRRAALGHHAERRAGAAGGRRRDLPRDHHRPREPGARRRRSHRAPAGSAAGGRGPGGDPHGRRNDLRPRAAHLHALDPARLPGRARRHGPRHRALLSPGERAARQALHDADQHRSGPAGAAHLASVPVRRLSLEDAGPLLDARPGRGHLGAQRGRRRRGRVPRPHLADPRGARADVLRRAGEDGARRGGLRLRRHRPAAAHVLPAPRRAASGQPRARHEPAPQRHPRPLHADGRPRGPDDGAARRRRRADRDVGPRVQAVPAQRQPQQLALHARLPGPPERRPDRGRHVRRRRLVEDEGLRGRIRRHLPEPRRPRGPRHRGARAPRRRRSSAPSATGCASSTTRRKGRTPSARSTTPPRSTPGPTSRTRPTSSSAAAPGTASAGFR